MFGLVKGDITFFNISIFNIVDAAKVEKTHKNILMLYCSNQCPKPFRPPLHNQSRSLEIKG